LGSDLDVSLGRRVRLRRTLLGISQAQLAAQLSLSQQQIALLERGGGRLFASHLYLLGRVLGVPVGFFFDAEESGPVASNPTPSAKGAKEPDSSGSSIGLEIDGRSDREVRQWIRVFLQIPPGINRSRLLMLVKHLTSQPDANAQLRFLSNYEE
jgi:transcriptional regulator with XRE-family HTH domain